ncbi:MAG: SRPBCC family protein [Chloroflexota bacterium]
MKTQTERLIKSNNETIYKAFLNQDMVVQWLPPDEMTGLVHEFDASEGGVFRITLRYDEKASSQSGKTSDNEDTFQGYFDELIPNQKIVQIVTFESDDPAFAGEMTMTITLTERNDGTQVTVVCENIPQGIRPQDNAAGWSSSLDKLAKLVED